MKKLAFHFIMILFAVQALAQGGKGFEPNFGISLLTNFPIINAKNPDLLARTLGGFGVFYQRPITPYNVNRFLNSLDYTVEAGFNSIGARDENQDRRYKTNYADLNLYLNFIPDRMSDDLRLYLGIRPSYVLYTETQAMQDGNYKILNNDAYNLNKAGDLDFGAFAGVNVSLGAVASIELRYVYSFSNQINTVKYLGRPSTIEVALKLSGIRIRDKIVTTEQSLVKELTQLSKGTMLVMLETPDEKLIADLKLKGLVSEADQVYNMQEQTNKTIIQEFRNNFNFCKLQFFINTDAQKVAKGDFENVFVDDKLNIISGLTLDSGNYFIASFIEDISEITNKPNYGLFVYDKSFVQMGKPYNVNQNSMGIFVGGDPMNYFRRVKSNTYTPDEFRKIIKRFNDRLQVGKIPIN